MKFTITFTALLALVFTTSCSNMPVAAVEAEQPAVHFAPEAMKPLEKFGVANARDPRLSVRAASGSVHLLSVVGDYMSARLAVTSSNDGGDSFSPPEYISEEGDVVSTHGENSPTLAFGLGREQYALFERTRPDGEGTDLMFALAPIGHGWDKPYVITDKAEPSSNVFSSLAVGPDGGAHAVWLDQRDGRALPPGTSAVYMASSRDRGKSFGANIAVIKGVCPCCRPSLGFGNNGEIHVSWRHVFEGNVRDIAVATSTDGGKTFGEPVRVANDGWQVQGCPHSGAAMEMRGDRLYMAWYSDGNGSTTPAGVRLAWSQDGAKTFSEPLLASQQILDTNHPRMSLAPDGRLALVFQGRDPKGNDGWSPTGAFVVDVKQDGSLSKPVAVPGNQRTVSYPAVGYGSVGRLFVAWSEAGPDGSVVYFNRGRHVENRTGGAPLSMLLASPEVGR